jgi:hypothetical protein
LHEGDDDIGVRMRHGIMKLGFETNRAVDFQPDFQPDVTMMECNNWHGNVCTVKIE